MPQLLDATTKKIQVKLGEAITTSNLDVVTSWFDVTTAGVTTTSGEADTVTNGVTAVDIVASPAASTFRQPKSISVSNTDTVTHTVIVIYNNSATLRQIQKATLLAGQTLTWGPNNEWQILSTVSSTLPTQQKFTSGSGATYTTPVGCRQIKIRMIGGGGGGSGSGTTASSGQTAGGNTIFNSINAAGGSSGGNDLGGIGGTGGAGTANVRLAGCTGTPPMNLFVSATTAGSIGGIGGGRGGGQAGNLAAGGDAVANSGGGGGGGGVGTNIFATLASFQQGAGGGEGEYVELVINNPAATYTYTVGAAGTKGTAGTSGTNGGAGGSGLIIVDELY